MSARESSVWRRRAVSARTGAICAPAPCPRAQAGRTSRVANAAPRVHRGMARRLAIRELARLLGHEQLALPGFLVIDGQHFHRLALVGVEGLAGAFGNGDLVAILETQNDSRMVVVRLVLAKFFGGVGIRRVGIPVQATLAPPGSQ